MNNDLTEWMQGHSRLVWAMGMPILLFLGHALIWNPILKWACAIIAGTAMVAVTLMAVVAQQWTDLISPALGLLIWMIVWATARGQE